MTHSFDLNSDYRMMVFGTGSAGPRVAEDVDTRALASRVLKRGLASGKS